MEPIPSPHTIEKLPLAEQIYLAANMMDAHRQAMYELRLIRRQAVRSLYAQGYSYGDIGNMVGLTRMQVSRIASQAP